MVDTSQTRFSVEYEQALAAYLANSDDSTLQRARELGAMARSLGVLPCEVVAVHAAALVARAPQSGIKEFTAAAEFLIQSLQSLEVELDLQRRYSIKRAAHELRTPLTTLRLALQVALGRLEKGGLVDAAALQKALAQVDKLAAKITEMVSRTDEAFQATPPSAPP